MARLGDPLLTAAQTRRLSTLTGIPADRLTGLTLARARAAFGAHVPDPTWLLFRRITGRVVDAPRGATVQVCATDCDLVTCFPGGWRWGWVFPHRRRDEVIASASLDGRGGFELWLPRFDLAYLASWRRRHYGFGAVFDRPAGATVASLPGATRAEVAAALDVPAPELADFDPARHIGPFVRPAELPAAHWGRLRDVPDLTLRVSRDGAVLHDGGCFEIPWHTLTTTNSGSLGSICLPAEPLFEQVS